MALLERDTYLAELAAVLRDAAAGQGSVVLVTGEAGAGKTSLVDRFAAICQDGARVLWGLCDEFVTPRPLGPFRDMFPWVAPDSGQAGSVPDLLGSLVAELGKPPHPAVAVVEDAQWADAATLDAIRFVGRRISRVAAVLVVTFRGEEVAADHPLRVAVGAIPGTAIRRIRLPLLSIDAVARLAGREDVAELYALTGGNPFYVNEVLAAPEAQVPPTVQDAVMARVGRLASPARETAELAAAVPGPAEPWLLAECGVADGVDEAVRAGVLRRYGESVGFPHELARRAVRHSTPESQWREINSRVLDALITHDADPTRLTHHAVQSDRSDAVLRYAPAAARRASQLGSHVEAFDHYSRALEHASRLRRSELLDLLEEYTDAACAVGRWNDAVDALLRAIDLTRAAGDRVRLGRNLCTLADVEWHRGRGRASRETLTDSIELLEAGPAGQHLVRAYELAAKLALVDHRGWDAIRWGERATETARQAGLPIPVHATVTVGSARLQLDAADSAPLVEALDLALAQRVLHAAARAYVNLADELTLQLRYDEARRFIDAGFEFFDAHDLFAARDHMLGVRARWHLERGRWAEAEHDGRAAVGSEGPSRTIAELIVGLVQARRGDPAAAATLDAASDRAQQGAEAQLLVPVNLARAELAWLNGDLPGATAAANAVFDRARESGLPRWIGEAALFLHRVGALDRIPDGAAEPYALQVAGEWEAAAKCWQQLGRPYDQADALAGAPEPEPLLEALSILDGLGASPRAAMVRTKLARLGVSSVPRGPRGATLASPALLTARQTEVLELLAEQLTYQEIAKRLHLSVKTVDHHVSAIRTKLDVSSREEAVLAGKRLGILT
jgi:DNA-binding CsgD family transcriptional regulator/tetratricopeptide (TPR) repeat protein